MDDLLDYVTGLVGCCLVPESDESPDDVSNNSSEENKDEESEHFQYYSVPYGHFLVPSFHYYDAMCLPIITQPHLSFASHHKF